MQYSFTDVNSLKVKLLLIMSISAFLYAVLFLFFTTLIPYNLTLKKQKDVLPRLHNWLVANAEIFPDGSKKIRSKSLLLIDDEADNASINTKKDNDGTTKINQSIKNILNLFEKSGYVG